MSICQVMAFLEESTYFVALVLGNPSQELHIPCFHVGPEPLNNPVKQFKFDDSLDGRTQAGIGIAH